MQQSPNNEARPWTPGPWTVNETGATTALIEGENGYPHARLHRDHRSSPGSFSLTRPADLADEQLIALAPEMAEAILEYTEGERDKAAILLMGLRHKLRQIGADHA